MSRSLIALWIALGVAIASISALAFFWNVQRTQIAEKRVEDILQLQLEPFRRSLSNVFDEHSRTLQRRLANCDWSDLQDCVDLARSPLADAVIVVNRQNQLHFPRDANLSAEHYALVEEAQQLLHEQHDPRRLAQSDSAIQQSSLTAADNQQPSLKFQARSYPAQSNRYEARQSTAPASPTPATTDLLQNAPPQAAVEAPPIALPTADDGASNPPSDHFGWITWYHRRGIVLGFWWQQSDAWRTLVVLPRARWMADLVANLPAYQSVEPAKFDNQSDQPLSGSLMQLVDVEGNLIYQWGLSPQSQWSVLATGTPAATLPLDDPLEGWRLRIFASPELRAQLSGEPWFVPLLLAVLGLSLALVLVGALVTVNVNRQMRIAERRVSFVNQVSHELRTPLTNICMYADLLAQTLQTTSISDSEAAAADNATHAENLRSLERIEVIQSESRRLSRLIGNVLEYARRDRKRELRLSPSRLDQVVRDVVDTFRPRLAQAGFSIDLRLAASQWRLLDCDVVEQILVNLISNAEKYAASGGRLEIITHAHEDFVTFDVVDYGPGIPRRWAERIFAPFTRMSDRLEDPAGTGIGLTIVRQLAKEHGGNCVLLPTTTGASFRCRLLAKQST